MDVLRPVVLGVGGAPALRRVRAAERPQQRGQRVDLVTPQVPGHQGGGVSVAERRDERRHLRTLHGPAQAWTSRRPGSAVPLPTRDLLPDVVYSSHGRINA